MTKLPRHISSLIKGLGFIVCAGLNPGLASATLSTPETACTSGPNASRSLLVTCQASDLKDDRSEQSYPQLDLCMSREWRDGGPFGGDRIPWYFINITLTDASGVRQTHTFDSPDGRHNFRSLLDYSELFHEDNTFSYTSHRTSYERPGSKGTLNVHELEFDFGTGDFRFQQDSKNGVLFGRWNPLVSVAGTCRTESKTR